MCLSQQIQGGKKAFILSIEVCQRWDNRFCPGVIDTRNISVENTHKIQPIKSDSLKENEEDLSHRHFLKHENCLKGILIYPDHKAICDGRKRFFLEMDALFSFSQ